MNQTPEQIQKNFEDLDYTQGIRRELIGELLPDAKKKDYDAVAATSKLLDGMDKVSTGRLKINEKSKENATRADESAAMAQFLVSLSDRRQRGEGVGQGAASYNPVVDTKLPEGRRPAYDKSVLDRQASGENSQEFQTRMETQGNR